MWIPKEEDKSPWEQYHTILLSVIAMYWILSMLDSYERFLVTWVSPLIFGLQHCCCYCNQIQLNMDGLWLNTLYNGLMGPNCNLQICWRVEMSDLWRIFFYFGGVLRTAQRDLQCVIYSLSGHFWIQCFGEKLPGGPSRVRGIRYSAMRIFMGGYFLFVLTI